MSEHPFAAAELLVRLMGGAQPLDGSSDRLTALFARLRSTLSVAEAKDIEKRIWEAWSEPGDPKARLLMQRATAALSAGKEGPALAALDQLIQHYPTYAEAWNKRATLRFVAGDSVGAAEDTQVVLSLEPRHFAALAGLGQILLNAGRAEGALRAFQAALDINPHMRSVRQLIEELRQSLGR